MSNSGIGVGHEEEIGMIGKKLALLAAVSAFGLLSVPLGADANQITFGPSTTGGITFQGVGGTQVQITIANPTSGPGFFLGSFNQVESGTFSFGPTSPSPLLAGPRVGENYLPTTLVTEPFSFVGSGNSLTATLTYTSITDNSPNPSFFANAVVTAVSGSLDFMGTFPVGSINKMDFNTTGITFGGVSHTLDELVAANQSSTVGISSGELVPGPIVGAGLPGLVAACGGLLGLARRRRRKQTA
jgi:hypothetical protein